MNRPLVPFGYKGTIISRSLLILLCAFFMSGAMAEGPVAVPPSPSMFVKGELVDIENGFALKADSKIAWTVSKIDSGDWIRYVGLEKSSGNQYFVSVFGKNLPEANHERAQSYHEGIKNGLAHSGWTVTYSSLEPSVVPRKKSFRTVDHAVFTNGNKAIFLRHFTSTGRLYDISAAIPEGGDEAGFQSLLQSFRFIAVD